MKKILLLILFIIIFGDTALAHINQGNWRWRNDDGDEETATWIDEENTQIVVSEYVNLRLRVDVSNNDDGAQNSDYGISYSVGSDDGPWTVITEDESNDIVMARSEHVENNIETTPQLSPSRSNDFFIPGRLFTRTPTGDQTLANSQRSEWEFNIRLTENAQTNATYYFNLMLGDGDNLETVDMGGIGIPSLVTGGELTHPVPDDIALVEPMSCVDNDFSTIYFHRSVFTSDLTDTTNDIYICANGHLEDGTVLNYCESGNILKMIAEREDRWIVTYWPRGYFDLDQSETLDRIEYYFTNEDKTLSVFDEDEDGNSIPFIHEFKCEE